MSDFRKAELKLFKEVAQDGLHISDSQMPAVVSASALLLWQQENGSTSNWAGHTISGDLQGTQSLNLAHQIDGVRNPYLGDPDTLDFTVTAAHNHFNMTIEGFNPKFWEPTSYSHLRTEPGLWQLQSDLFHDLLQFEWDSSTGVTNETQAQAAVSVNWGTHDATLNIHTPSGVDGTITFKGLADLALHQINVTGWAADTFGWVDHTLQGYGSHAV